MRRLTTRSAVRARGLALVALLLLVGGAGALVAQRGFGRRGTPMPTEVTKLPYDGRFAFARIRFPMTEDAYADVKWAHDYPRAERHFMEILSTITSLQPTMGGGTVLDLSDPDLFRYPFAYLCEPGYWAPSDEDVVALRAYLQKGGFLIVDDFPPQQWYNFEQVMRRVLPDARPVRLEPTHPIFDSFYHLEIEELQQGGYYARGQFLGYHEDDDPTKRLMVIVNYGQDMGELWEFSDEGVVPVDISNLAYKLGINYLMYAMTH